jgi:DNA-binding Lrp family transcriptional regulator
MSARANKKIYNLTDLDRKLLKILLMPNGGLQESKKIATKLRIPFTTIVKRRKRLEDLYLKLNYSLEIEKFGWRRVDFFISVLNGKVNTLAKKLSKIDEVTYVAKSIGQHTIDLRVEAIVKDNVRLLDLLEEIKEMDGVGDVVWSEIINVVSRKISVPHPIIDKF